MIEKLGEEGIVRGQVEDSDKGGLGLYVGAKLNVFNDFDFEFHRLQALGDRAWLGGYEVEPRSNII